MIKRALDRLKFGDPVVVVSGLPRSGTSMAMRMLKAGGVTLVEDGERTADEDNPVGYFEDERVKNLAASTDTDWVRAARGKAIKVVSSLLHGLPAENRYKVVFMLRDLHEVLASQAKMLARRKEVHETADDEMIASYQKHLDKVRFQLRYRANVDALYLEYADVVADPRPQAERINAFLGGRLDVERMVEAVDPKLYRNRREALTTSS